MNCHASDSNNATGAIRKLLSGVVSISGATNSLAERRQATLDLLVEILSARFGIWSWGIGDVLTQGVQPLALLTSGYTQHQTVLFTEAALSPEADREFCRPILARMGSRITSNEIRSNLFDRESWLASGFRKHLQKLDADEWVNSVRYHSEQVFSSMFFLRSTGEPEFVQADADLVELAMESIGWLHSNFEECAPKDLLVGLTERQRLIAFMILDGQSRKMIASRLSITENTVGDHVKSIFRHFKINSATELAAIFLRNTK